MKIRKLIIAVFVIVSTIAFYNCKKEKTSEPDPESAPINTITPTAALNKSNYYPYEAASIQTKNITLSGTNYPVTINGMNYTGYVAGNDLGILMPNIAPGNYIVKVIINGTEFTDNFTILSKTPVADPMTYFNNSVDLDYTFNQNNLNYLNSLTTYVNIINLQNDIGNLQNQVATLKSNFSALSSTDQQLVADILDANKGWLDSLKLMVQNVDGSLAPYMRTASWFDAWDDFKGKANPFVLAVIKTAAAAGLVAGCITAAPVIGTVAAASVTGAVVFKYCSYIKELQAKEGSLLNHALDMYQNLTANKTATTTIDFNNNESKEVTVAGTYRSINNTDANNTNPDISAFYGASKKFVSIFSDAPAPLLSSLGTPPVNLDNQSTFSTFVMNGYADYILIGNISNSNINNSASRVNGQLFLTFSTTLTSDIPFTFDLIYVSKLGLLTKNCSAILHGSALAIGDSYQGGIVAYILQQGDPGYIAGQTHGLIAAPSDQVSPWNPNLNYTTTGAIATAIGTGNSNTNIIVSNQGTGSYAAKLCYDLILGGYSDWYLPSKDELNKLYLNQVAIGGFTWIYYWSSTEIGNGTAWGQSFDAGVQGTYNKGNSSAIRAVRAF